MEHMERHDWDAIETEYITTKTNYRKLSEKWGVPKRTLSYRASKGKWVEKKREYNERLKLETIEKVLEDQSDKDADKLSQLRHTTDRMSALLDRIVNDLENGFVDKEYSAIAVAKPFRELTGALKDLTAVVRDLYNIKPENDTQNNAESETGIVMLAQVLENCDE